MNAFRARVLVELDAPVSGVLRAWDAPLSFWGGCDAATGTIIDRTHPGFGEVLAGTLLYLPSGRGSSSTSSVLAEAIRLGTAPHAILLGEGEPMFVTGALVARLLYGTVCPIVVCEGLGARAREMDGREAVLAPEAGRSDSAVLTIGGVGVRGDPDA